MDFSNVIIMNIIQKMICFSVSVIPNASECTIYSFLLS